jgi:hypothetical protein
LGKAATSLVVPGHIIRRRQGASAERRGKTAAAALSCPGAVEAHAQSKLLSSPSLCSMHSARGEKLM